MINTANEDIYLDTDFLKSFIDTGSQHYISSLNAGKLVIPNVVDKELRKLYGNVQYNKHITNSTCLPAYEIQVIEDWEEVRIYESLTDPCNDYFTGPGEAAALAMVKVRGGILASNNMKDVLQHATQWNLRHITSLRVIAMEAIKGNVSYPDTNYVLRSMKTANRKLPSYNTIQELINSPCFQQFLNQYP